MDDHNKSQKTSVTECHFPDCAFKTKDDLLWEAHKVWHEYGLHYGYFCPTCENVFSTSLQCEEHVLDAHGTSKSNETSSCNLCNYVTASGEQLRAHSIFAHYGDDTSLFRDISSQAFSCPLCSFESKTSITEAAAHFIDIHLQTLKIIPIPTPAEADTSFTMPTSTRPGPIEENFELSVSKGRKKLQDIAKAVGDSMREEDTAPKKRRKRPSATEPASAGFISEDMYDYYDSESDDHEYQPPREELNRDQPPRKKAKFRAKPFKCLSCNMTFSSYRKAYRHVNRHFVFKSFKCNLCLQTFALKKMLKHHFENKHSSVEITLDDAFSVDEEVRAEQKSKCDKMIEKLADYEVHENQPPRGELNRNRPRRKKNTVKSFKCLSCNMTFSTYRIAFMHANRHFKFKPFKCNLCFQTFTLNELLEHHFKKEHSSIEMTLGDTYLINERVQAEQKSRCDKIIIKNLADNSSALAQPAAKKSKRIPVLQEGGDVSTGKYKCLRCRFRADSDQVMQIHAEQHVPRRKYPFVCRYCETRHATIVSLNVHHKACHSEEIFGFYCDNATQQLFNNSIKKIYTKTPSPPPSTVNPAQSFKCLQCHFATIDRATVERHVICKHLEMQPYTCPEWPQCSYRSKFQEEASTHVRFSHNLVNVEPVVDMSLKNSMAAAVPDLYRVVSSALDESVSEAKSKSHVTHSKPIKLSKDVWQCSLCQISFKTVAGFKRHYTNLHSCLKPYLCNVCNYQDATKAGIMGHLRTFHKKEHDTPDYGLDEKMLKSLERECFENYSRSAFRAEGETKTNEEIPAAKKPREKVLPIFHCLLCDFTTIKSQLAMKMHIIQKHTQQVPFACTLCHFFTSDRLSALRHARNDHFDAAFPLEKCVVFRPELVSSIQQFISKSYVREDPRVPSVKNGITYVKNPALDKKLISSPRYRSTQFCCTLCKLRTGDFGSMFSHILISHSREMKSFLCPYCNMFSFTLPGSVYSHVQRRHNETFCVFVQKRNFDKVLKNVEYGFTKHTYCGSSKVHESTVNKLEMSAVVILTNILKSVFVSYSQT